MIRSLCSAQTPAQLESAVLNLVETIGEARFRDHAAEILTDIIRHSGIIPEACQAYRCIVEDGILYFISKLPVSRLAGLVAHQASLDEQADAGRRLVEMAKQIPTFHKLGQMIARNRKVDPKVREWLVQLENGIYSTDAHILCRMIEEKLGSDRDRFHIRMSGMLLSEASVGGVVPFRWREVESGAERDGVFKVLKPVVETRLKEELAALDCLTAYFENRRHLYSFGDFRFRELFEDVKTALLEELNLVGEQEHLLRAHRFYRKNKQIRIPRVAPFSSRHFTAMSRIDGAKVTDTLSSRKEREEAAEVIFRAIICDPLFSVEEFPIFHGDPHAGNIFSSGRSVDGNLQVALLDWSQAGHLARRLRVSILKFIQGLILGDEKKICRAVAALSSDFPGDLQDEKISGAVERILSLEEYRTASLMKKTFIMMEQLSFNGIRFHRDLLLFRKAFFTLDGLIYDLDPEFDMDHAVMAYIRDLIVGELPRRIAAFLIPMIDAPEKYRSLLSNRDLQMLLVCQAIELVKKNTHMVLEFMEKHVGLVGAMFSLPKILNSRTAKVLLGLYYLYRMRDAAAEA